MLKTQRTKQRITLIFILLSPVLMMFGYLCIKGIMNYTGFCWAERRWLSDEELRYRIVDSINKKPELCHYEDTSLVCLTAKQTYIPFNSSADIIKNHPDCCVQHSFFADSSQARYKASEASGLVNMHIARAMGFYHSYWTIHYPFQFRKHKSNDFFSQNLKQTIIADNCANSIDKLIH